MASMGEGQHTLIATVTTTVREDAEGTQKAGWKVDLKSTSDNISLGMFSTAVGAMALQMYNSFEMSGEEVIQVCHNAVTKMIEAQEGGELHYGKDPRGS